MTRNAETLEAVHTHTHTQGTFRQKSRENKKSTIYRHSKRNSNIISDSRTYGDWTAISNNIFISYAFIYHRKWYAI